MLNFLQDRNQRVLALCLAGVFGMGALSFASVPLYSLFCQVTGFGGTTQVAGGAPETVLEREVTVRFDSNVAPGLAWDFEPEQLSQTLRVGEVGLAFYTAANLGPHDTAGIATFNVTPHDAGIYFQKLQCFCFDEQVLTAGEETRMPVYFYVDPSIADEPQLDDLTTITLSYTFFASEMPQANAEEDTRDIANVAIEPNMGQTSP